MRRSTDGQMLDGSCQLEKQMSDAGCQMSARKTDVGCQSRTAKEVSLVQTASEHDIRVQQPFLADILHLASDI